MADECFVRTATNIDKYEAKVSVNNTINSATGTDDSFLLSNLAYELNDNVNSIKNSVSYHGKCFDIIAVTFP